MAYVAVWRAVEMRPGSTAVSGPQQRGGRGLVVVVGPAGGGAVVELVPDRGVGAAVQQHPQRLQSAVVRSQVQRGDAPPVLRAAEGAALVRVGAQLEQPPRRRRGGAGGRGPGQRGAAWTSAARLAPRQMTGGWAHEGRGTDAGSAAWCGPGGGLGGATAAAATASAPTSANCGRRR